MEAFIKQLYTDYTNNGLSKKDLITLIGYNNFVAMEQNNKL